jgi:hypothetical protein
MTVTLLATFVEQAIDDAGYRKVMLEQLLAHAAGLSNETAPKGVSLVLSTT